MRSHNLMLAAGFSLIVEGFLSPLGDLPANRQVLWGAMALMAFVVLSAYRRSHQWHPYGQQ